MTIPFEFFSLPSQRSTTKPRKSGLTMVMDWGMSVAEQEDWLSVSAPYVDLIKVVVGTARLYDETTLSAKLRAYKKQRILTFVGGMFLEYVLHEQGLDGAERYIHEAKRLGFEAVEISDNLVPFSEDQRINLIRMVCESDMMAIAEVGSKSTKSSAADLIIQIDTCLEFGAEIVLVEAAELFSSGEPDTKKCEELSTYSHLAKVMFELGGPWIPGTTTHSVFALRLFLIQKFGADVNLANVMPELLLDTEATRVGLGDPLEDSRLLAERSAFCFADQ